MQLSSTPSAVALVSLWVRLRRVVCKVPHISPLLSSNAGVAGVIAKEPSDGGAAYHTPMLRAHGSTVWSPMMSLLDGRLLTVVEYANILLFNI